MADCTSPPKSVNSSDNGPARILIADDYLLVAEALKHLLEPEFHVVGVVSDGHMLMESLDELRPNVVILDILMPELNGLEAGEQIKNLGCGIKIVYLTNLSSPEIAARTFRRAGSGYVLKHGNADEIRIAVRWVLRGDVLPIASCEQRAYPTTDQFRC